MGRIHENYLRAGAHILTTNTFAATPLSQKDFGTEDVTFEINKAGAAIARALAEQYSTPDEPRFVAGSIGPTNRSASLSPDVERPGFRNISFDELVDNYSTALAGLIAGGIDLVLIETIFDTLNAKAAIYAVMEANVALKEPLPIMISGTITDASGRTLSGQTCEAFLNSIAHADPVILGLNCALGAEQLRPYIGELAAKSNAAISVHPNAGLPNAFGEYDQSPEEMAAIIEDFANAGWLNVVGGCCGTTPEHIRAIHDVVADKPPRALPDLTPALRLSGLEPVTVNNESLFVNVGERTNVTGSARFCAAHP